MPSFILHQDKHTHDPHKWQQSPQMPLAWRAGFQGREQPGAGRPWPQCRGAEPAFHHLQAEDALNQCLLAPQQVRGLEFR